MTALEQNDIDIQRMAEKRANALKELESFKKWYLMSWDEVRDGNMLLILGLTRDILRGTEKEVDRLQEHLEERNQAAFMKKMSQGINE